MLPSPLPLPTFAQARQILPATQQAGSQVQHMLVSTGGVKFIAFTIGAFVLVGIAKIAPGLGIGLSVALLIGVILSHVQEVTSLLNVASTAMQNNGG